MKRDIMHVKDLLVSEKAVEPQVTDEEEFVTKVIDDTDVNVIPVKYVDTEAIEIGKISDTYGRLSDIIDAMELATGLSVTPFEMADISFEVVNLKRHEIFELNGSRFAMSKTIREDVVESFVQKIIESLKTGLPYVENLKRVVTYKGNDYKTYALSKSEWTLILSKFRKYKGYVRLDGSDNLILEIHTERLA